MQRSALCRSRRELSNAYLLAKFGFDTAENEPSKVCRIPWQLSTVAGLRRCDPVVLLEPAPYSMPAGGPPVHDIPRKKGAHRPHQIRSFSAESCIDCSWNWRSQIIARRLIWYITVSSSSFPQNGAETSRKSDYEPENHITEKKRSRSLEILSISV